MSRRIEPHHMHFKDGVGGPSMAGYCPLGLGKVNLVAILDLMEGRTLDGMIMVELDGGGQMPYAPREIAQIARDWLVKNGQPVGDPGFRERTAVAREIIANPSRENASPRRVTNCPNSPGMRR